MKLKLKIVLKKNNGFFYNCFEYLLALVFILECRSIWTTMPSLTWFKNFLILLLGIFTIGCIITKVKLNLNKLNAYIIFIIGVIAYSIIYIIINRYNTIGFFKLIFSICLIGAYVFLCVDELNLFSLLQKYKNLILIIICISLFFWIFGSLLNFISSNQVVSTTWTNTGDPKLINGYYNLYFETQKLTFFGIRFIRNTSIFTEAPMASFHFSIAFLVEYLLNENKSYKKIFLCILGIISTFSTTGYIVILLAFLLKYFFVESSNKYFKFFKFLILPIVTIVIIFVGIYLLNIKLSSSSGSLRLDDFRVGFLVWKDNPLFGWGYGNNEILESYMNSWRNINTGFSNSIMQILSQGGLFFLFPYLYSIIIGIKNTIANKDFMIMVFIIIHIMMFAITITSYQYINIYLFLLYLHYVQKKKVECL